MDEFIGIYAYMNRLIERLGVLAKGVGWISKSAIWL